MLSLQTEKYWAKDRESGAETVMMIMLVMGMNPYSASLTGSVIARKAQLASMVSITR